jgi:diacylglycerol kinase
MIKQQAEGPAMAETDRESGETWSAQPQSWPEKFRTAFRGLRRGIREERSFAVHGPAALVVVMAGIVARLALEQWCLLMLCIGAVLTAELFNTALESLGRAITSQFDPQVQRALDTASGAVLLTAITAAIVGVMIFVAAALNHEISLPAIENR